MKVLRIILSIALIINLWSCQEKTNSPEKEDESVQEVKNSKENFDWLLGDWKRLNNQPGKENFESWSKTDDLQYNGFSYTLEGTDTVFWEKMNLIQIDKEWSFQVRMKDGGGVDFKVFNTAENSFKCANKKNDFPKVIEYLLKDDQLLATISADSTKVPFVFSRLK